MANGSVGSFAVKIYVGSLSVTSQPPGSVVAGVPFRLDGGGEDAQGHVITNFNEDVTLSVANSQGPGTLYGTVTVAAVNGVATFTDLSLEQAGSGYTITAAYSRADLRDDEAISVTAATASKLSIIESATSERDREHRLRSRRGRDRSLWKHRPESFAEPLTIAVSSGPPGAVAGWDNDRATQSRVWPHFVTDSERSRHRLQLTASHRRQRGQRDDDDRFAVTPAAALEFAAASEAVDETTVSATIEVVRAGGYTGESA